MNLLSNRDALRWLCAIGISLMVYGMVAPIIGMGTVLEGQPPAFIGLVLAQIAHDRMETLAAARRRKPGPKV